MGPATRPITRIAGSHHRVRIVAMAGSGIEIDGSAMVDTADGTTTVDEIRSRLTVTVPEGSDVLVGVSSGRVDVIGRMGRVAVVSQSGRVTIEAAESVDVRSASARVTIGRVGGACVVDSETGGVVIEACGSADLSTRTGRIEVAELDGPAHAHSVSGRVQLGLVTAGDVEAETVTGRISISYPRGTRIHRVDRGGGGRSRPDGTDCTVAVRSVSGRIEVTTT